ncbi:hypothetical protein L0F63_003568 [Massospora cicadina]|nr:hypothetical protein L0F63_003568 [Massospora cicadina]
MRQPSLDSVLNSTSASPYSLHDFRLYLFTVEHSVENLEFLLWFEQFRVRYAQPQMGGKRGLNWEMDCSLLPESILCNQQAESFDNLIGRFPPPAPTRVPRNKRLYSLCDKDMADSDFDTFGKEGRVRITPTFFRSDVCPATLPFSMEMNAIIRLFLAPCSPMELNLPYAVKRNTLLALKVSSHPDVLLGVAHHVHQMLLTSFPSFLAFVRRERCGCGNVRRLTLPVLFAILNVGMVACLIVFGVPRWWRMFTFPLFLIAMLLFVLLKSGPCLIQLMHIFPTKLQCSTPSNAPPHTALETKRLSPSCMANWGRDPFFSTAPASVTEFKSSFRTFDRKLPCSLFANPPEGAFQFTNPSSRNSNVHHQHGWLCLLTTNHLLISTAVATFLTATAILIPTFPLNEDPFYQTLQTLYP